MGTPPADISVALRLSCATTVSRRSLPQRFSPTRLPLAPCVPRLRAHCHPQPCACCSSSISCSGSRRQDTGWPSALTWPSTAGLQVELPVLRASLLQPLVLPQGCLCPGVPHCSSTGAPRGCCCCPSPAACSCLPLPRLLLAQPSCASQVGWKCKGLVQLKSTWKDVTSRVGWAP